jgi:hypothetical protein
MNTFYYVNPTRTTGEVIDFKEYSRREENIRTREQFAVRHTSIEEGYAVYLDTCKKYNCTEYEIGRFIASSSMLQETFEHNVKSKHPNAVILGEK